jgi:hypothetical protein
MNKILLAFSGSNFSVGAYELALRLNRTAPIALKGFFLPELVAADFEGRNAVVTPENEDEIAVINNIRHFTDLCERHHIEYHVHTGNYQLSIPQLVKETRFADLLILGSEVFYQCFYDDDGKDYLHDALHKSECPVVVVPEQLQFPEQNIIAYDGSASCVYAVRQFAHLFPELCEKKTTVVYATNDAEELPHLQTMEELMSCHFPDVTYLKLEVLGQKYFNTWVTDQERPLLIAGAFERSTWSAFFRKSFIAEIVTDHKIPLFIGHR